MVKNKRLLLPAALAVASCLSSAALAQTTATWLLPTSGDWTDPTMWSTNPYYPTNGNPSGATYDAVIDATGTGPAYTIQANAPITVTGLTINSALATVDFQQLLTAGTINVDAGTLAFNSTSGATISSLINSGSVSITGGSSTIGSMSNSGSFTVSGATVNLGDFTTTAPVSFVNSTVILNNGSFDPSLIQRTGGTLGTSGTFHNLGTINLDTLGPLEVSGTIEGGTITGSNPNLFLPAPEIGLLNVTIGLPALNVYDLALSGTVTLQGTSLTVRPSFNLSLAAGTTLGGTGQVFLNSPSPDSFGANSTIGPGIAITTTDSNFTGNLANQGTIVIPSDGSLRLNLDSYSNSGSMQLNGGVLILGNSSKNVGLLPADVQQNFTRTGGQVLLGGSYNFTGQTIDLSNTPLGPVDLSPVSITGGTLLATGRTINFYPAPGGSMTTLNGVTLASNTQILATPFFGPNNNNVVIGPNGLTLQNVTVDLNGGNLGGGTIGGSGTIIFDGPGSNSNYTNSNVSQVVIGPGITLIGGTGNGLMGNNPSAPSGTINNGTISTGANGNWIAIEGSGFVNNGTVEAINGGRIILQFPLTNNGSVIANNATLELFGPIDWNAVSSMSFNNANLTISGSLDNTGKTIAAQENGRSLQISPTGSITGGTIAAPIGGTLSFVGQTPQLFPVQQYISGPNLSNLTLSAPANVSKGANAYLSAVDVEAPLTVNAGGLLRLGGNTIINQPITDAGGTLQIDSISNNSTIIAIQNSTVRLTSWAQNPGNLTLTDSVLQIPNFTNSVALIESISRTNSPVELAVMNITGQTLTLDRAPEWYIGPATITGGEIIASQSTPLVASGPSGFIGGETLIGVTLKGPLQMRSGDFVVAQNSLTLDNGQIVLTGTGDGSPGNSYIMGGLAAFPHSPTQLSGNGEVIFDNDPAHNGLGSGLIGGLPGDALTIGSGITIHNGDGNGILTGSFVSNGTVSASAANTSISLANVVRSVRGVSQISFQNNGTMMAVNGGTLNVDQAGLTNFSAGTLTGGTYEAFDSSVINFTNPSGSASITTNNANVLLSGPNSHFDAINALSANLGHFSILGGRLFTTAGDLSNTGTVSVGDQSLLTVAGGLSLGQTSVLDMTLGAGHGTLVEVQGSANLDGQLQIELADGFMPAGGDQFAFMTAGSFDGNFSSFDLPTLPGSESWDTSQASAGIISVTPEPSMLGIGGLLSASLLLRRRRQGMA